MFSYIEGLMNAQTLSGRIICWITIGALLIYLAMAVAVMVYYSGIKRRALRLRNGSETGVNYGYFGRIQRSFEDLVHKGCRDSGQTAILDNAISGSVKVFEYMIHYLPSFATILGLMGTFIGLTGAIGKMDLSMEGMADVESIINNINAPITDMSTAFYTSLVGIVCSAVMNVFERVTRLYSLSGEALENAKDYLNVEYLSIVLKNMSNRDKLAALENDPASMAWQDATARIAASVKSLNESIEKMGEDIASLESRGLVGLSNNLTSLVRTYQLEHDDVRSVNESMRNYLSTLQDLGRALEKNQRISGANEQVLEQIAVTYRMLAEEHRELIGMLGEDSRR